MGGLPKSYIKKYGITKKAWREYRKTQSSSKTSKNPKKKGVKTTKSNRARKAKTTLLGNLSLKGLLIGTISLTIAKYLAKKFAPIPPRYVNGAAMIGTSFLPIAGVKGLRPAGIMDIGSELASDVLIGGLEQTTVKGYDV